MYRCVVLLKNGEHKSKNDVSKDELETWILKLTDKYDLKKSIIENKENKKERYIENF